MTDLSWRDWHMGAATHAATKSKDSTKVGAAFIAPPAPKPEQITFDMGDA